MTLALILGALLAVAAVAFVAWPFLAEPEAQHDRLLEPRGTERTRLHLAEERDRALDSVRELEFDHRTGKVSDEDYRRQIGPLRRRAAELLRASEPPGSGAGEPRAPAPDGPPAAAPEEAGFRSRRP